MLNTRKQLAVAVLILFIGNPFCAFAQTGAAAKTDSLIHHKIPALTVSATRIEQPLNFQPTQIDVISSERMDLLTGLDVGRVLGMESFLFMKSYGPGGLANASQRGLSPEQTQVLWEGIPINSVVLGLTDFSLIPADFFSSIEVSSGTPSSAFGGGGLAGSVYLNSEVNQTQRIAVKQGVGSFGDYRTTLQADLGEGNWSAGVKTFYATAQNNFNYYNPAFNRREPRRHNSTKQFQFIANAAYDIDNHHMETKLWFSDINNKIPGKILDRSSKASQENQAMRWLSNYRTNISGVDFSIKNYLEHSELNYFDSDLGVESKTQTGRWLLSAALKKDVSGLIRLKGEISSSMAGVESSNYAGHKIRRKASILFNPVLFLLDESLKIYPAFRVDSYNDFGTEVSPSLGLNYELLEQHFFLRGQISRNFNPPTFNDLYWPKTGNSNLKPGHSINIELGTVAQFNTLFIRKIELTLYRSAVEQGILWLPNDQGQYTPSNIKEIRVRGLELASKSRWKFNAEAFLKWEQKISYTRSQIASPRFYGDAAVGNQLRYVPEWAYNTSLAFHRLWFTALAYYRWTGRRYVTDTESKSNSLAPYGVADLQLQAQKVFGDVVLIGRFRVKNIFDERYQIIKWYPMPGRNYHFSLTVNYNF